MQTLSDPLRHLAQAHAVTPQRVLERAFEQFDNLALSFSGAEDVVLIHMASQLRPRVPVFCLDTGRLHPQTYAFIEQVRSRYALDLTVLSPDAAELEALVATKGLFSFYADGHQECCAVRKVGPLKRHLAGLDAWITGMRRDQSPDTRAAVAPVEVDRAFSAPERPLVKFNPLAQWSSAQVWAYIHAHEIPYNPLHRDGFVSIGCEPCTRAVAPHQHERAGRWWWEESGGKECGLHAARVVNA